MTNPVYTLGSEDKLVPAMFYTPQRLLWGRLITKNLIRVSTWLQTEIAPMYLDLADAQVLLFGAGQDTRNLKFPSLHVEKEQIMAYHILPPADESPYYDIEEPFRKMEPVTAIVGIFRFDGAIRMTEQSNLKTFLGGQKGDFLPMFDLTITCPLLPNFKGIKTPYSLVRQEHAVFSPKV